MPEGLESQDESERPGAWHVPGTSGAPGASGAPGEGPSFTELDELERFEESTETLEAKRAHRLHPLSPLFEIGRSFVSLVVPGLVVLFLSAGDGYEIWYMAFFIPAVAGALLRYLTKRYVLEPTSIVVREGLVFRSTRSIPYARIQNIDTVQNPLHRIFRVVEVRLETASGQEPEAVFRVLSWTALQEIRAGVLAQGRQVVADQRDESGSEHGAEHGPAPFFRMRPIDVAYFGLLSQKGLALLAGALFLVWELDLWDRVLARLPAEPEDLPEFLPLGMWILFGVLVFLALQLLTVAWAFLTLQGFHIVRTEDDLRTTCGLWTRQTATIPRQRIQFLSLREGLLQRLFRRAAVKALTAGGDSTGESQVSRKWLVPLTRREALPEILREVQPEADFEHLDWQPVHPRARRRLFLRWSVLLAIPVALVVKDSGWWGVPAALVALGLAAGLSRKRARRLGFALADGVVYVRDGVFTHVRNAVRFPKIQSVSLRQTPFDRRHRMATVRVDTAGNAQSDLSFSIPFLDVRVARRLAKRLRREAAETSFTW